MLFGNVNETICGDSTVQRQKYLMFDRINVIDLLPIVNLMAANSFKPVRSGATKDILKNT